ncbi:aspartate/glutamate racemase family protein [Saliphagus sp. LR7]|uniref:aspartate/glutamate racemase family protein n=1 Tax=Saliphagus sp. LR7 TaxID=2282654 RepID=UPI000DF847B6|nr:amino acid racemase [Saliphagus sp. LR7]
MLGVLGGVGPAATVNFLETLLAVTPAERDQDHVESIVYNDPTIPDRTEAIRGTDDVGDQLVENARALDSMGVDSIVIASNLTHYWYDDVAEAVDAEVRHMIRTTCETIGDREYDRVGILSTTTARDVGLYEEFLDGVEVAYPEPMEPLMDAIYRYKAGEKRAAQSSIAGLVEALASEVDAVVLGCTEFSAMEWSLPVATIDPVEVVAQDVVHEFASEPVE